jgi:ADP-ribose pyrophosphatase YjhB (NUDIX family)
MALPPGLLARGPWTPDQVHATWTDEQWRAPADLEREADAKIIELSDRGSPAHDGLAARLDSFEASADRLALSMQPSRWALRLVDNGGESQSLTALCVVRDEQGRWLAGRRASWLATWANKWALGAGGAVEVGEDPSETLSRELEEEWQLTPARLSVEALVNLPSGLVSLVGLAVVPSDADPVPDAEHDEFAWWPPDVARWPDEADDWLRALGSGLARAGGDGG